MQNCMQFSHGTGQGRECLLVQGVNRGSAIVVCLFSLCPICNVFIRADRVWNPLIFTFSSSVSLTFWIHGPCSREGFNVLWRTYGDHKWSAAETQIYSLVIKHTLSQLHSNIHQWCINPNISVGQQMTIEPTWNQEFPAITTAESNLFDHFGPEMKMRMIAKIDELFITGFHSTSDH